MTSVGIVLRRYDFGDSSQIGHLLTPADGRISVLAKGIKKPNAYLKGPFDLFHMARITWRRRRGSDLGLLVKYEPVTGFPEMRKSLPNLLAAFYLAEILYEGVREEDPNPEAFDVFARALGALDTNDAKKGRAIVLATEARLLESFGFGVAVDSCVRCGRSTIQESVPFFPFDGGVVCDRCPKPKSRSLILDPGDARLYVSLAEAGPRHAARIRLSTNQHKKLRLMMRALLLGVFERPMKSEPFVIDPRCGFLPHWRGSAPRTKRASQPSI